MHKVKDLSSDARSLGMLAGDSMAYGSVPLDELIENRNWNILDFVIENLTGQKVSCGEEDGNLVIRVLENEVYRT